MCEDAERRGILALNRRRDGDFDSPLRDNAREINSRVTRETNQQISVAFYFSKRCTTGLRVL